MVLLELVVNRDRGLSGSRQLKDMAHDVDSWCVIGDRLCEDVVEQVTDLGVGGGGISVGVIHIKSI